MPKKSPPIFLCWVGCDARAQIAVLFPLSLRVPAALSEGPPGLVQVEKERLEHRVEKLIFHFCEKGKK